MPSRVHLKCCLPLLLAIVISGCNSDRLPTYEVVGALRFSDGTHPMFGNIEFYSKDHKLNARGQINRDGTFTVGTYSDDDGAVEGTHQIAIIQTTSNHLTGDIVGEIKHDHGSLVDTSYFDYRTSDLECTILPKINQIELTIRKNSRQTADGMPISK